MIGSKNLKVLNRSIIGLKSGGIFLMINIKKLSLIVFIIYLGGCMEPNQEDIWSVKVDAVLNTNGFCRSLSVSNDTAYVAAGQSGVQIWDLNNEVKLQNYFGYIQDFANIEFDDIVLSFAISSQIEKVSIYNSPLMSLSEQSFVVNSQQLEKGKKIEREYILMNQK